MKKIMVCIIFLVLLSGSMQTSAKYVIDDSELKVTTRDGAGTKINGSVPVGKDTDGTYVQFDGNGNNYIQLEPLPALDIAGEGLHIVFKAKWEAYNTWSRVFDCGNGSNEFNIFISNSSTSSNLAIGMNPTGTSKDMNAYVNSILALNTLQSWDITISENNGNNTVTAIQLSPGSATYTPGKNQNGNSLDTIERTKCYIGKSNWSADAPFKGKIYYVRVETGKNKSLLFEFDAAKMPQG